MVQTTAPISSVSPSLATVFKVPDCSAVSSNVALSDSNSAIISSISTKSPSFLTQRDNTTSVIDSPTGGTLISKLIFLCILLRHGAWSIESQQLHTLCAMHIFNLRLLLLLFLLFF